MRKSSELVLGFALSIGFSACASAPPPPAQPAVEPPAASVAQPAAAAAAEPAAPPVASAEAPPAAPVEAPPAAPAESSKPSHPPLDILTSADTAFQIDYNGSAPIEAARRSCAEKSAGDPEAQAKCLSEARDAFKADVIRFRKDGAHWSWTIYKRVASRLDEVSSSRVDLKEASPNSVQLKFLGGDKGTRPILKNKREAVLSVPNDYSFELDDAEWGKLSYEAKIGLVDH